MAMVRTFRCSRLLTAFLALWLVILIYFIFSSLTKSNEAESILQNELQLAKMKNMKLISENSELKSILQKVRDSTKSDDQNLKKDAPIISDQLSSMINGPSKEYEISRRQTIRDVNEMWWFVRAKLESIMDKKDTSSSLKSELENTLKITQHHAKAVLKDMNEIKINDGYENWRHKEAEALSNLVQARIKSLQNPSDCQNAKKLVCNLNKGCGYGCQIHHAIYCLIVAYGTERMLVLKSKGWRYDKAGFEDVFMPLSESCPNPSIKSKKTWPGSPDSLVVELGIIDSVHPRPKFLPPAIPRDLSDRIVRIHGNPIVWWVAQFLKYLLRPGSDLASMLKSAEETIGIKHPIVGIHVRRTDKVGTEAAFHKVSEYMKYVEEYFQELSINQGTNVVDKHVYVASDDPKVLAECRKSYPDYTFLGDTNVAKSAAVSTRYNLNSLRGIITDIHMLSITDYLVCTFSSQVCRIAYEIMQNFHVDAADRFKSLDDIWYFGGQDEHQHVAIMTHEGETHEEMDLKVGDVIGVAGNHWNGYNKGKNHRSHKIGLYPEYKTQEKLKIEDFPTYPNVKL